MKYGSYLHNLRATHDAGYAGNTKFSIFKWPTPPTTWLAMTKYIGLAEIDLTNCVTVADPYDGGLMNET